MEHTTPPINHFTTCLPTYYYHPFKTFYPVFFSFFLTYLLSHIHTYKHRARRLFCFVNTSFFLLSSLSFYVMLYIYLTCSDLIFVHQIMSIVCLPCMPACARLVCALLGSFIFALGGFLARIWNGKGRRKGRGYGAGSEDVATFELIVSFVTRTKRDAFTCTYIHTYTRIYAYVVTR